MGNSLVYGFLDESPSLNSKAFFFCVNIISTNQKVNINLQGIMKKARKRVVNKKLKSLSEFKFYHSDERTRMFVLSEIAKHDVEIFALVVDKEDRQVKDDPQNYGMVVGSTIAELLFVHPNLSLTVDKKYTSLKQQDEFMQVSQETINKLAPKDTFISFNPPEDSRRNSLIQLADFVAGALNFKYNEKNSIYTDLIKNKVVVERVIKWRVLKKRIVNP